MGERGPARTPTKLKLLRGDRHKDRQNPNPPKPKAGYPVMPADLTSRSATVWRRVRRAIEATQVITQADVDVLRSYCEAVARYEFAAVELEKSGPVVRGPNKTIVKNPLHQVVRDNATLVAKLARELGLTPSAREVIKTDRAPADPLDAWLDGTG
jgi:P27 family predicted phage terminase small subunit